MKEKMQEFPGKIGPKEAIEAQKRLRDSIRIEPLKKPIRTIAGADVSLERFGKELYAGITVLSYPDLTPIEYAVAKVEAAFPYIPGLLSFREIPGLLACLAKLKTRPDLIMVDGQGIAHPRRLGIASHLGLVTGIPTIGCAKSRLYGVFDMPKKLGAEKKILDPYTGGQLGYALSSKARSNPLIISPGHKVSLDDSLAIVKSCLRGYRLPEPTREAHQLVNRFRKGEIRE
jgi:deoxyribonuclease V